MEKEEMLKALEAQVLKTVEETVPKVQGLINQLEDEFDIVALPVMVRVMVYEAVFTDVLAKFIATGSMSLNVEIGKYAEGVCDRLKKGATTYQKIGEHNVHANSVGEELSPDKTNV